LFGRCYDVETVKQRRSDVTLTLCAGWDDTGCNKNKKNLKFHYIGKYP